VAEVVLIHGIAQEQQGPASLEALWLPALADGVRAAGDPQLADRIWHAGRSDIDVRMAAYGDLFLTPGAMGDSDGLEDLDPEAVELAGHLAMEWLRRAAERDDHPDHQVATRELSAFDPGREAQGPMHEAARAMIGAVTSLRWFAVGGMAFAERFVNKALSQVTRYMTDAELRAQVQGRVIPLVGPDTKVIIGHSLGSVVAYEVAAHSLNGPLPLLLTLGSPLGLRTIIYDRLRPQPPTYPSWVNRWVNISDRNDLVAAEPDLTSLFRPDRTSEVTFESAWTVDNGAKPHEPEYYLRKQQVGRPIVETLRTGAGRG
jgi:hypothetical protein